MNDKLEDDEEEEIEINRGDRTKSEVKKLINNITF